MSGARGMWCVGDFSVISYNNLKSNPEGAVGGLRPSFYVYLSK